MATRHDIEPAADTDALLRALARGDEAAFEALLPLVYDELRRIAAGMAERQDGTLQPTALVHEAFLRLSRARGGSGGAWDGRTHLLSVAARAMRQLVSDHARRRGALKRGGGMRRVTLDLERSREMADPPERTVDFLALDEALSELARLDARQARIVELRYFGGLANAEIAKLLGLAERTVEFDLQMARVFLRKHLT